jgi:hypothetical protein
MTDEPRSYEEIGAAAAEHLRRLSVQCTIDRDFFVFKLEPDNDNSPIYEVPLLECDTHAKLIGWQLHLADKSWMTLDLLAAFTEMVCEHHNLSISR